MAGGKPVRYRPRSWHLDTWQVSWEQLGQYFAVRVRTDPEGIILEAAPLVWRFVGQKLKHLTAWVRYKQVKVVLLRGARR